MLELMHLPLNEISESPLNTRKYFSATAMDELTASVKSQGVLQPILVRPFNGGYQIVAGARRYRAAGEALLETIPAVVREMDDSAALEATIIENLQRENVHPLEEAEGYELLLKQSSYNAEQLGAKIGKSRAYIYARMKLLDLCEDARTAFFDDKLDASVALLVARIPGKVLQKKALKEITGGDGNALSFRNAKDLVRRNYMLNLKDANFRPADAKLLPAAGSCTDCSKRTGNDPDLYSDVDNANVCTDPKCYEEKRVQHFVNLKEKAQAKGIKVIEGAEAKKIMPYSEYGLTEGYISLDARCHEDAEHRTYREILGKDAPVAALLENTSPYDNKKRPMIELANEKALAEALKKAGITAQTEEPDTAKVDQEYEQREKELAEARAWRKRLFDSVRLATGRRFADQGLTIDDLRALAKNIFRVFFDDLGEELMALYHGAKDYANDEEFQAEKGEFSKSIDGYDVFQLGILLADLSFMDELHCMTWDLKQGKQPDPLIAEAQRLGLDLEAIKDPDSGRENAIPDTPAAQAQRQSAKKTAKAKTKTEMAPAAPSKPKKPAAKAAGKNASSDGAVRHF